MTLTSVNFPSPYPNNALCVWVVTADEDTVVVLQFTEFDLQRSRDTVVVVGGHDPTDGNALIARLSSSLGSARVISKGPKVWLKFQSDGYFTGRGFSLRISQETPGGEFIYIECIKHRVM